jgi:hypothetical protein
MRDGRIEGDEEEKREDEEGWQKSQRGREKIIIF